MQPPKTFNVGDTVWFLDDIKDEPQERVIVYFVAETRYLSIDLVEVAKPEGGMSITAYRGNVFTTLAEANQERLLRLRGAFDQEEVITKRKQEELQECVDRLYDLAKYGKELERRLKALDKSKA